MTQHELLVRDGRTAAGAPVDVVVRDGVIAQIGPGLASQESCCTLDARGALVLPGYVDAHLHLDKTLWGQPWRPHTAGSDLADLMANDLLVQLAADAPVAERAGALLEQAIARGTRALRSHADVAPEYGLRNVEGVLAAAQAHADAVDVQVVAFPQLGLLSHPGTAELLEEAAHLGVHAVGGLDPLGVDDDLNGHLDVVFGIAARHGIGVDLHLHDVGPAGRRTLDAIAERTRQDGLAGMVVISHAFVLGELDDAALASTADDLADAGVAVVTCALGTDAVVPADRMSARGVRVGLGSDGIRDAWSPFGNADMLERAHLLAYRLGWSTDKLLALALEFAGHRSAEVTGLPTVQLRPGDPADLVLVRAPGIAQLVVDRPRPDVVLHAGRVVAESGRIAAPVANATSHLVS